MMAPSIPAVPAVHASRVAQNLWVGAAPPPGDYSSKLDVIVLVASDYQPRAEAFPKVSVRHHPFDDTATPVKRDVVAAARAAREVATDLKAGKRVLVTCRMGRNRSGFVAALALRLLGVPAKEALRVVRSRRKDAMGVRAISNPEFQRLLLRT